MVGGSNLYIAAVDNFSARLQLELLKPSGGTFSPGPSVISYGDPPDFGSTTNLGQASWVTIYGDYLSSNSRAWTSADFNGNNAPTMLDGTSVTIGGQPAYISYISPGQINAQIPNNIGTGPQPLIVTTPSGSSSAWTPTVNPTNPGLLAPASFKLTATQLYPYAVALFPDGATYVLPVGTFSGVASRPAVAGDTITFYGIGFGDVTPYAPAGQITGGQNALAQQFGMTFVSGSQQVKGTVNYAGLSPGLVGLYQFNVVVPKLSVNGPVAIQVSLGGTTFGVYYVALQ
jgi:uncharacterized protein (TIGR03437 family)